MLAADKPLDTRFQNMREHLHAAVHRRRMSKGPDLTDTASSPLASHPESRLASGWELNSFVTPLDSRMDKL